MPSSSTNADVLIAGGGLSGLAAAVDLAERGASVLLCERAPRFGGRCYSYPDPRTGDVVDNGQHVLLGAYRNALDYLGRIGTRHFLRKERSLRIPLHHPEKGFVSFSVPAVPKPLQLPAGMLKFGLLTLAERRKLLNVGLALSRWSPALERDLAAMTVDQWLEGLGQSAESMRCLWHPIAVSVMNELPGKASALLFARALRSAFLGKREDAAILIPTVGQTELYVSGAVEFLAARKAKLRLNTGVESLEVREGEVSKVALSDGTRLSPGSVISAVPYGALGRIIPPKLRNEPPFAGLPRIESSPIISLHLWFEREFMEADYLGLIGRRIQWLFNRRRILGGRREASGYISAVISGAQGLIGLPPAALVAIALDEIGAVYPGTGRLLSSVVIKERRATFSPTCDVEPLRPPAQTPLRNLLLAGDWTDTGLPATIEGAILSGFTAAAALS